MTVLVFTRCFPGICPARQTPACLLKRNSHVFVDRIGLLYDRLRQGHRVSRLLE